MEFQFTKSERPRNLTETKVSAQRKQFVHQSPHMGQADMRITTSVPDGELLPRSRSLVDTMDEKEGIGIMFTSDLKGFAIQPKWG